jgi:hypothetical protein
VRSSWTPYSTEVTKKQDVVAHLRAKLGVPQLELIHHVVLYAPRFRQHIPATNYEELRERQQALLEQQRIAESSASYQRRSETYAITWQTQNLKDIPIHDPQCAQYGGRMPKIRGQVVASCML